VGAWGKEPFENDDALDFMEELQSHPTWEEVRGEFNNALAAGSYLEAPDGSQVVAGAALVASNLGAGNFLPEEYADIPSKMGAMPKDLVLLARKAIAKVLGEGSELKELWQENESEYADWLKTLTDIQTVLDKPL